MFSQKEYWLRTARDKTYFSANWLTKLAFVNSFLFSRKWPSDIVEPLYVWHTENAIHALYIYSLVKHGIQTKSISVRKCSCFSIHMLSNHMQIVFCLVKAVFPPCPQIVSLLLSSFSQSFWFNIHFIKAAEFIVTTNPATFQWLHNIPNTRCYYCL